MSASHRTPHAHRQVRGIASAATLLAASLALAACSGPAVDDVPLAGDSPGGLPSDSLSTEPDAVIASSISAGAKRVPVDQIVEVTAENGTLDSVEVTYGKQDRRLRGDLADEGSTWTARQRLEPGVRYQIRAVAVDEHGRETVERSSFRTEPLSLDQQTYPSIAPLDGETVGVGMPVIISFDVAVADRASIERHLDVESSPSQVGAWHWISDHEVHWRPRDYWKPGTAVTVKADVNSVPAGNGIYGQLSRTTRFKVGEAMISRVNVAQHKMRVFRNGTLLKTIPISAGKPGFTTRSGTKVIIEKFREKRMDAATTGIDPSDPEYYNIEDVEYALRVTYSGEFLHAAPWSSGSQGSANVSHGCVGMSTSDAGWLYNLTRRGDVVEVTGSDRQMTLTNGFGDWNAPFAEYREGSALN